MDCFHLLTGLSGLECFASHPLLQKILMPIIIVPAPKCCPDFFFFVLLRFIFHFFVRGPVLSTADPTFYLSYLIFILSDIWSLLSLVLKKKKKKKAYWKKRIKQLWFLKCTVDSLFSLCHVQNHASDSRWRRNGFRLCVRHNFWPFVCCFCRILHKYLTWKTIISSGHLITASLEIHHQF